MSYRIFSKKVYKSKYSDIPLMHISTRKIHFVVATNSLMFFLSICNPTYFSSCSQNYIWYFVIHRQLVNINAKAGDILVSEFKDYLRTFLKDIVYFKDNIKCVRRNDLDVIYIDCIWLEFKVPKYSIEHYISHLELNNLNKGLHRTEAHTIKTLGWII